MSDNLKLVQVTASIAQQAIAIWNAYGVQVTLNIRDVDGVYAVVNQQDCPLLQPHPAGFVTDLRFSRDSYGADVAYKTMRYMLHYDFFYAPVGQGVTMFNQYDEMVAAAAAILLHFATHTNLTGSTDFVPQAIPSFRGLADYASPPTPYHGCEIAFEVMQYLEA